VDLGWPLEVLNEQLPVILERIVKQRIDSFVPTSDENAIHSSNEELKMCLEQSFHHEAHFGDDHFRVSVLHELKKMKLTAMLPHSIFSQSVSLMPFCLPNHPLFFLFIEWEACVP
jgi:hypothetical protein